MFHCPSCGPVCRPDTEQVRTATGTQVVCLNCRSPVAEAASSSAAFLYGAVVALGLAFALAGCSGAPDAVDTGCSGYVYYNHTAMWGDTDKMQSDPQGVCYVDTEPGTPYGGSA